MQSFGHRYSGHTITHGVMTYDQASHIVAVFDRAVFHTVKMQDALKLEQGVFQVVQFTSECNNPLGDRQVTLGDGSLDMFTCVSSASLNVVSMADCLIGYIVERVWGAEVVVCNDTPSVNLPPEQKLTLLKHHILGLKTQTLYGCFEEMVCQSLRSVVMMLASSVSISTVDVGTMSRSRSFAGR